MLWSQNILSGILRIAYGALTVVCSAGLLEITAGAFAARVDPVTALDPVTRYAYKPGLDLVSTAEEYRITFRTDSMGLRGGGSGEVGRAPPTKGGFYFIGDSFTEGLGVDCEKTFAAAVARSKRKDFFNAGMHGGAPPFYVLRNQKFLKRLAPEAVFVQIYDNDAIDMDAMSEFISPGPSGEMRVKPLSEKESLRIHLIEHSSFLSALRIRLRENHSPWFFRAGTAPAELPPGTDASKTSDSFGFYGKTKMESPWSNRLELLAASINRMILDLHVLAPDARLVLIHIPDRTIYQYSLVSQEQNAVRAMVRLAAARSGAIFVDGQVALSRDPGTKYFPGNGHINADGHAAIARAILMQSGVR